MSGRSIETKYRPQDWKEVLGQDAAVRSLQNAVEKKLGTAYLFIGPSGTGKTTLARIAAAEFGCAPEDIEEVDGASTTGIDDTRALIEGLRYRPLGEGGVKGVIIDECFLTGTLVDTPAGPRSIESLSVGDSVFGAKGIQTVVGVAKRRLTIERIVRVTTKTQVFYVSREHLFLTLFGWKEAEQLDGKQIVKATALGLSSNLCRVWDQVHLQKQSKTLLRRLLAGRLQNLWNSFPALYPRTRSENLFRKVPALQYENSGTLKFSERSSFFRGPEPGGEESSKNHARARNSVYVGRSGWGWERTGVNETSGTFTLIGWWLSGICNLYWQIARGRGLALQLQGRSWFSRTEASCRNRWSGPQAPSSSEEGQEEEDPDFETIRVESATASELQDFIKSRGISTTCSEQFEFYDLEIKEHPSFSVAGMVVHNCHALSKAAVQSLLKTLEDPPSWVYWFLCTTEATKIPVAIKTRCLTYQLKEVRLDDLIELLESTDEAKGLSEKIITLCAKEARGSPRQALSNLGVCAAAKTVEEAAELLHSAEEAPVAFDLARALMNGADWKTIQGILGKLGEVSPESVRHVVRGYFTKVALDPKNARSSENALAILEAFSTPFNSFDGLSPLVLACARLVLAS